MNRILSDVAAQPGKLRFDRAAENFNEALPIGNGHQGGMVYGQFPNEKISLNEDTLWAGEAAPNPISDGPQIIERARKLMLENQESEAETLIAENFLTAFNQPYLPVGELFIHWPKDLHTNEYKRELDIATATATVDAKTSYGHIVSNYYGSYPHRVLAVDIARTDGPKECKVLVGLTSKLQSASEAVGKDIILKGIVPSNVRWNEVDNLATEENYVEYDEFEKNQFYCVARIITDGKISTHLGETCVADFSKLTLLIATRTNRHSTDAMEHCIDDLDSAERDLAQLHEKHVEDFGRLFNSVELQLAGDNSCQQSIDECTHNLSANLAKTAFDYGRYLLISSSRPGTQPANLKGVWSEAVDPAWWSNYTININTQMNYWPAEMCGLSECHEPLIDFIEELAERGRNTAKIQYGLNGWVAHHQVDFHRQTTPVGALPQGPIENCLKWGFWPFGGAWLALHTFEHFQYNQDIDYLRDRAFPILSGAASFIASWLVDDPTHPDQLTTIPSTSPENTFLREDGTVGALSRGTTMDIAIAKQLFSDTISAAEIIGKGKSDLINDLRTKLARLPEPKISEDGRILEFDKDYPEAEHPHRHISPVFGLCPGTDVTVENQPDLCASMKRLLEFRGPSGTGWSLVWKARTYARLRDGEKSFEFLDRLFEPVPSHVDTTADDGGGIYPNMLMACPPFCIEANLGFVATMIELFVQDKDDFIHLLPALPAHWKTGKVKDLKLRNQVALTIEWQHGLLTSAQFTSQIDQKVYVKYLSKVYHIDLKSNKVCDMASEFDFQNLELT
jgi:alpha-L-fucosidase 2